MRIGAIQKFSMIDYPGKLCAIVFTQGCNFRCPYCHNPELVDSSKFVDPISEETLFAFLKKRVGKLDAVSITGGEPTLHQDLPQLMKNIKKMGFLVKLDTNGTNPEMLNKIITEKAVDYLAMDIKAPLEKYSQVTRSQVDTQAIHRSIQLIKKSDVDYEFRSTLVQDMLSKKEVLQMGHLLGNAKRYFLQNFVPNKTLNRDFADANSFSNTKMDNLQLALKNQFLEFAIR
jgi:pyruvate formate lyase activating enzyme